MKAGFQGLTTQKSDLLRTPRAPGTPRTPFTPSTPWTPFTRQHSGKLRQVELPGSWPATCEWVLKNPISLWELLLEPIFEQVNLLSSNLVLFLSPYTDFDQTSILLTTYHHTSKFLQSVHLQSSQVQALSLVDIHQLMSFCCINVIFKIDFDASP